MEARRTRDEMDAIRRALESEVDSFVATAAEDAGGAMGGMGERRRGRGCSRRWEKMSRRRRATRATGTRRVAGPRVDATTRDSPSFAREKISASSAKSAGDATAYHRRRSSLHPLERLPRLLPPGFLPLHLSRIPREHPRLFQRRSKRGFVELQRLGDAVRIACACPLRPPPLTCALTSNRPTVLVTGTV